MNTYDTISLVDLQKLARQLQEPLTRSFQEKNVVLSNAAIDARAVIAYLARIDDLQNLTLQETGLIRDGLQLLEGQFPQAFVTQH